MDRVTHHANILTDSLISNPLKPQRLFCRPSPHSGEGNDWPAREDGSQVKLNLIHESLIQELPKYFATAFHEHTCDFLLTKLAQKGRQVLLAVNDRARCESIRKKPSVSGEQARAGENNAPRLSRTMRPRGETRIVSPHCLRANQDCIDLCTQASRVAT